jgi:hypothetical protein
MNCSCTHHCSALDCVECVGTQHFPARPNSFLAQACRRIPRLRNSGAAATEMVEVITIVVGIVHESIYNESAKVVDGILRGQILFASHFFFAPKSVLPKQVYGTWNNLQFGFVGDHPKVDNKIFWSPRATASAASSIMHWGVRGAWSLPHSGRDIRRLNTGCTLFFLGGGAWL